MLLFQLGVSAAVWSAIAKADLAYAASSAAEAQAALVRRSLVRLSEVQNSLSEFLRTRAAIDGYRLRGNLLDFSDVTRKIGITGWSPDSLIQEDAALGQQLTAIVDVGAAQRDALAEIDVLTKQTHNALVALAEAGQRAPDRATADAIAVASAVSLRPFTALNRYLKSEDPNEEDNLLAGLHNLMNALEAVPLASPDVTPRIARLAQTATSQLGRLAQAMPSFDGAIGAQRKALAQIRSILLDIDTMLRERAAVIIDTQHQRDQAMADARGRIRITLALAATISSLMGSGVAMLLGFSITRPLLRLAATMRLIAEGATNTEVPDRQRRDEVGSMATALQVFKDSMNMNVELVAAEDKLLVENAELNELAHVDGLTGLANRRRFDEVLAAEFSRCARDNEPLSLILVDVDKFKIFNDAYGHQAGDACLMAIGLAVGSCARRQQDLAARYGGEELVIVLPNTDQDPAARIAERVCERVRALGIVHCGATGGIVTASCGVATGYPLRTDTTPADILRRADRMLYRAKEDGRDRVIADSSEPGSVPAEVG